MGRKRKELGKMESRTERAFVLPRMEYDEKECGRTVVGLLGKICNNVISPKDCKL
jgi:hypothetical protein